MIIKCKVHNSEERGDILHVTDDKWILNGMELESNIHTNKTDNNRSIKISGPDKPDWIIFF